jgi:hypothetical protein
VEVRLAPEVAEGTVVRLALDRRVTELSNQAGTVVVSAENGELRFEDGEIVVGRAVRRQLKEEKTP